MTVTTDRRALLRGIVATAAASAALAAPALASATVDVDAVLAAWRAWRPLEEEDWILSGEINDLYSKYRQELGIPGVEVFQVHCQSPENIDKVCDRAPAWMQPAVAQIREAAKRELEAVRARDVAFMHELGLTQRQERSDEITGQLQPPLIRIIEEAAGSSPVVIAAKLDLALSNARPDNDLEDVEVCYIAEAIRGLMPELPAEMQAKLAPIAACEGSTIREIYTGRASIA